MTITIEYYYYAPKKFFHSTPNNAIYLSYITQEIIKNIEFTTDKKLFFANLYDKNPQSGIQIINSISNNKKTFKTVDVLKDSNSNLFLKMPENNEFNLGELKLSLVYKAGNKNDWFNIEIDLAFMIRNDKNLPVIKYYGTHSMSRYYYNRVQILKKGHTTFYYNLGYLLNKLADANYLPEKFTENKNSFFAIDYSDLTLSGYLLNEENILRNNKRQYGEDDPKFLPHQSTFISTLYGAYSTGICLELKNKKPIDCYLNIENALFKATNIYSLHSNRINQPIPKIELLPIYD